MFVYSNDTLCTARIETLSVCIENFGGNLFFLFFFSPRKRDSLLYTGFTTLFRRYYYYDGMVGALEKGVEGSAVVEGEAERDGEWERVAMETVR